ncbi:MAG: transporter substrate-binding domain-containing protein [Telmatospirillum sp.]|nr:transporter substrate-binding domain-containing protein [Telmatospirillum sp.]
MAAAAPLVITTEEYPPFNMTKGGDISGLATEIVKKAMEQAKIEFNIALYPWQRAYDMALKEPNTCVYSTTLTDQRQPLFKWVGPVVKNDWMIFAKSDSTAKPNSLDDLKSATIGGYQGDALTLYLKEKGMKVDEANADQVNPKKLQAGHIDYWASGRLLGPYIASQQGVTGIKPVLLVKETKMYLACNKGVADETIDKLNAAIKVMSDDGTIDKLNKAYQ